MSKNNHNLYPSLSRRCNCGRYITIGEDIAGIGVFGYTCPDCVDRQRDDRNYKHVNTCKDFFDESRQIIND